MLIEVQMLNLALLPPFCQTLVICCPSFGLACLFVLGRVVVRWLGSSFAFVSVGLCFGKNANVLPKALAYSSFFSGNIIETNTEISKTPPTMPNEIGEEI